jgi:hypothetical protein
VTDRSKLYLPRNFNQLRLRATERVVTLRDGRRARVTVDDSGTVTQIETDDRLDAVVRPRAVRLRVPLIGG